MDYNNQGQLHIRKRSSTTYVIYYRTTKSLHAASELRLQRKIFNSSSGTNLTPSGTVKGTRHEAEGSLTHPKLRTLTSGGSTFCEFHHELLLEDELFSSSLGRHCLSAVGCQFLVKCDCFLLSYSSKLLSEHRSKNSAFSGHSITRKTMYLH